MVQFSFTCDDYEGNKRKEETLSTAISENFIKTDSNFPKRRFTITPSTNTQLVPLIHFQIQVPKTATAQYNHKRSGSICLSSGASKSYIYQKQILAGKTYYTLSRPNLPSIYSFPFWFHTFQDQWNSHPPSTTSWKSDSLLLSWYHQQRRTPFTQFCFYAQTWSTYSDKEITIFDHFSCPPPVHYYNLHAFFPY